MVPAKPFCPKCRSENVRLIHENIETIKLPDGEFISARPGRYRCGECDEWFSLDPENERQFFMPIGKP